MHVAQCMNLERRCSFSLETNEHEQDGQAATMTDKLGNDGKRS